MTDDFLLLGGCGEGTVHRKAQGWGGRVAAQGGLEPLKLQQRQQNDRARKLQEKLSWGLKAWPHGQESLPRKGGDETPKRKKKEKKKGNS